MGYMLYVAAILAFPFPSWFPRSHLVGFSISLSDPTWEAAVLYAQEKANKSFAFSVFFNVGCTIQATGALASWPRLQYTTPLKAHVGALSRSPHIRHTVGQNMYQTTSMRYSVCIEKKRWTLRHASHWSYAGSEEDDDDDDNEKGRHARKS